MQIINNKMYTAPLEAPHLGPLRNRGLVVYPISSSDLQRLKAEEKWNRYKESKDCLFWTLTTVTLVGAIGSKGALIIQRLDLSPTLNTTGYVAEWALDFLTACAIGSVYKVLFEAKDYRRNLGLE